MGETNRERRTRGGRSVGERRREREREREERPVGEREKKKRGQ